MQKKLIALAIAGLSGAAYAQSNVTIYGVVDNTFESVKVTGKDGGNRVSANSSYLGFKGEENLGNGLKAKFLFEQGLNTDDTKANAYADSTGKAANGGVFGTASRDAWIALSSDQAGEVRLGTFNRASRTLGSWVDQTWGYSGITTMKGIMGAVGSAKVGTDERINNAVGYFSPVFSGFQVTATYGANEAQIAGSNGSASGSKSGKAYDLGALYNNGPLKAGVTYTRSYFGATDIALPVVGSGATTDGYAGTIRIGGAYTFPTATTVSAMWDKTKVQNNVSTTSNNESRNAYELAVKQAFGANSIFASYAKAKDFGTIAGAKQYVIGYGYDLSKRTTLKAYWTRLKNDTNAAGTVSSYALYDNAVGAGETQQAIGVGVRHSF